MKRPVGALVSVVVCLVLAHFQWRREDSHKPKQGSRRRQSRDAMQRGDEANEFAITGEDGKTYQLRNSAIDLSKHVGHTVTITGAAIADFELSYTGCGF